MRTLPLKWRTSCLMAYCSSSRSEPNELAPVGFPGPAQRPLPMLPCVETLRPAATDALHCAFSGFENSATV